MHAASGGSNGNASGAIRDTGGSIGGRSRQETRREARVPAGAAAPIRRCDAMNMQGAVRQGSASVRGEVRAIRMIAPPAGLQGTLRATIDLPATAPTPFDGYRLEVNGWVHAEGHAIEAVQIMVEGECLLHLTPLMARPDVVAAFGEAPGSPFHGFRASVCALGLRGIRLEALIAGKAPIPFAEIDLAGSSTTVPVPATFLRPLSLLGLGRSGTSQAMALLGMHPGITVAGAYPFDVQAAAHWAQQLMAGLHVNPHRTTGQGMRRVPGLHPLVQAGLPAAAARWLANDAVAADIRGVHARIEQFYRLDGIGKPGAIFFAEKDPYCTSHEVLAALYPAAVRVFLIRDPRDVLCSMQAINRQRGWDGFGREYCSSDSEHVDDVARRWLALYALRQREGARAIVLRYEDMVTDPAATLRNVFAGLGLDAAPRLIAEIVRRASAPDVLRAGHATTASPFASLGRWRRDLAESHRRQLEAQVAPVLAAYGYDPAR